MIDIPAPGVRYTTFRDLFLLENGMRVRLTVPDYQRAYDWRPEHRRDLFDDLQRLRELDRQGKLGASSGHFCGTVICTPGAHRPERLEYDVVDGQQRLTTLAILHSRLATATGVDPFLISGPNVLFRPQSIDRGHFGSVLRGSALGAPETLGQCRYLDSATETVRWIDELGDDHDRLHMLRLIEERLQFIFFVLPDAGEVSKVFETINNRGKPLSQMDLVKNHLIYMRTLNDWDGDVDQVWSEIQQMALETAFQRYEDVDTVLRAVVTAMFRPGKRRRGETDHDIVKERIGGASDALVFDRFLNFLKSSFRTFRDLRSAHLAGRDDPVRTQLTNLNHHPSLGGALPLILVRQFCRLDEAGADVLAAIEKANFRLYGLMNAAKRSDSYNVVLHTLAHDYLKKNVESNVPLTDAERRALSKALIADLTRVVTDQHKNGLVQIVKALTLDDDDGTDFYHWDALRYFLARWEESLMNNQSFEYIRLHRSARGSHSNDYLAREHVYPVKSPEVVRRYREGILLRRLGNFMLLPQGVNCSLGNAAPAEKVDALEAADRRNSLLVQNRQLGDVLERARRFVVHLEQREDNVFGCTHRSRFNGPTRRSNAALAEAKTLCDLREEMMVEFALRAWRMPGEMLGESADERFLGMMSFRADGETYLGDDERPGNKEVANYVLTRASDENGSSPRAEVLTRRLLRRRELVGPAFEAVGWTGDSEAVRRAA